MAHLFKICLLFLFLCILKLSSFQVFSQPINEFIYSEIQLSPDSKQAIVTSFTFTEAGPVADQSKLYFLPFDSNRFVKLQTTKGYRWIFGGEFLCAEEILSNTGKSVQEFNYIFPTNILIYSKRGDLVKTIQNGCSLINYFGDFIFYMNEFDDEGNRTNPKLVFYNFKTSNKKIVYQFHDSLTVFFPEIVDIVYSPEVLEYKNNQLRVLLYVRPEFKSKNSIDPFTFVFNAANELIFIKNGNYLKSEELPQDGFIKKRN